MNRQNLFSLLATLEQWQQQENHNHDGGYDGCVCCQLMKLSTSIIRAAALQHAEALRREMQLQWVSHSAGVIGAAADFLDGSEKMIEQQLIGYPCGQRLKMAMKLRGITQRDCAKAAGVSGQVINYAIRTGRQPQFSQALAIARLLKVDAEILFTDSTTLPVAKGNLDARWSLFASDYGYPSTEAMVLEAVEEFIDATECYEHGYDPMPTNVPQMVIMSADACKRLLELHETPAMRKLA